MTKQEILNHGVWQYISKLSPKQRNRVIFGSNKLQIEETYNVSIEEWAYTNLPKLKDNMIAITITNDSNTSSLAVLIPKK